MLNTLNRYMYWVSAAILERYFIAVATSKTAIVVCSATKRKSRCPTETFSNTFLPSIALICRLVSSATRGPTGWNAAVSRWIFF